MTILPFRMIVETEQQRKIVQEIIFLNGYTWAGGDKCLKYLNRKYYIFEIFDNYKIPQLRVTGECDYDEAIITFDQFFTKYKINPERKQKLIKIKQDI